MVAVNNINKQNCLIEMIKFKLFILNKLNMRKKNVDDNGELEISNANAEKEGNAI